MAAVRFCEICKVILDSERAEANRETRLCDVHVEAIKKYGGEFLASAEEDRISKPGSLKINYGGIGKITRVRNHEGIERLRDDYLLEK